MNKMWKRSLSLFLAIVMIVGVVPMGVFAEEQECAHADVEYIDEAATCIWEGYYAEYCNDCQQYLVEELLDPAGHDFVDGVCTACGEAEEVEPEADETEEDTLEEQPEAPAFYAAAPEKEANALFGNVWLDKNRENDLAASMYMDGLRKMVLTAVGMGSSSAKVYYVSNSGEKYDVSAMMDLLAMYNELSDKLKGQTELHFMVGSQHAYVWFRNIAHLEFDISIPNVESTGEPENLQADIETALAAAKITVRHGGDVIIGNADGTGVSIAEAEAAEALLTVETFGVDKAKWPALTKSVMSPAGIKVSIRDSVSICSNDKTTFATTTESGKANLKLVDDTATYTITFNQQIGETTTLWNQIEVIEGHTMTEDDLAEVVQGPVRAHYTFNGWYDSEDVEVDLDIFKDKVYANATYTTLLKPDVDEDGNGESDYTQFYNIVYINGTNKITYSQRYGTKIKVPAKPAAIEGKVFTGWYLADEDAEESDTVVGHATYVAGWRDKTDLTVSYTKNYLDGTNDPSELPLDSKQTVGIHVNGTVVNNQWYVKNIKTGELEEWDFDNIVAVEGDEDYTIHPDYVDYFDENGVIHLECEVGFNENGNEYVDGTADDPIVEVYLQYIPDNSDEWMDYGSTTIYVKDMTQEEIEAAVDAYIEEFIKENEYKTADTELFVGWVEKENVNTRRAVVNNPYYVMRYYKPLVVADNNANDVADTEELAKITDGELKDGTWKMALGTVSVPGLQDENGVFLANSTKKGAATEIIATPGDNAYVDQIKVNGKAQNMSAGDNGAYSIKLHEAVFDSTSGIEGITYKVEVVFKEIKAEFKETPDAGVLIPGKQYTDADDVAVYNAVVASPVCTDDAVVDVWYVAREAETVTVDISDLRTDIENRYGKIGKKMLDKVWPGDTIPVKMDEITKEISYKHDGMVMTPQQVVDNYILEFQDADFTQMMADLTMLKATIEGKVKASANVRPFMYNNTGDDTFKETVIVRYEDSQKTIYDDDVNRKPFEGLKDGRTETAINTENVKKAFKVGTYDSNDALKEGAFLHVAGDKTARIDEAVELAGDFVACGARTYKGVPIYFAGNTEYKPAVATFDLKVIQSTLSLTMEQAIAVPYGKPYEAMPTITLEEGDETDVHTIEYISVVAGVDLNDLDLDLSKNNPYVDVKNLNTKAWIHLPENLKGLLEFIGVDVSANKTRSLKEIEAMFIEHRATLEQYNVPGWAIDRVLQVLNKVNAYAAGSANMEIVFVEYQEDVYPTNPGVYANMAIVNDPRYNTAYTYGGIMVAPVLALPDRGDVQLKLGDKIENVYVVVNDLMPKEMVVTYKGTPVEAPVYYYGMNAEFETVQGIPGVDGFVAPSEPGIYLASTLYNKDNNGTLERMGSDVAIIVIGLAEIEMDVKTEVIAVDGNAHRPEINVTIPDGKGGTVVKDYAEAGVGLTLISGEVNVDRDGDIGLDDLSANVNIQFPKIVYDEWPAFAKKLNNQTEIDMTGMKLDEDLAKSTITPAVLRQFLEWCKSKNTGRFSEDNLKMTLERLQKLHVPAKYIDDVMNFYNKTLDKLIEYCGDLQTAANKLPDKSLLITFDPAKSSYSEEGIYFYLGVVTDPDYIPYANTGVMVLQAETNILLNTHVPYDGKQHAPAGWDKLEGKNFTLVLDRENDLVNIISDPSANAIINEAINELEEVAAKVGLKKEIGNKNWLDGKTIGQLHQQATEEGEKLADLLVDKICDKLQTELINKIPSDTVQTELNKLKAEIVKRIDKLSADLFARLENLNIEHEHVTIVLNEDLPVNAGTYEFYTYSGEVTVSRADLVIEPIYVYVEAMIDAEKEYDGVPVDDLTPYINISYYSYDYLEGTEREEGRKYYDAENSLPADIAGKLHVSPSVSFDKDWVNVGTYPIDITAVSVNYDVPDEDTKKDNVCTTAEMKDGTLTITQKEIEVLIAVDGITGGTFTKYYGNAEPKFEAVPADANTVIPEDVTINVTREGFGTTAGENVGTYVLSIEAAGNANYTVKLKEPAELKINPAEINLIGKDETKGFDQPDEVYEYTYEIVNGFGVINGVGEYDEAVLDKELDSDHLNVTVERERDEKDDVGDQFIIYVKHKNNDDDENNNYTNINVLETINGILTITLGDYICYTDVEGEDPVPYTDVTDALAAIRVSGGTVRMLKDATAAINEKNEETIIVYAGTTFDLNGFYVEADNLLSFGVVMDSLADDYNPFAVEGEPLEPSVIEDSATATVDGKVTSVELTSGGILISNDTTEAWTQLQTANGGYMPIYDTKTGSYKFFKGEINSYGSIKDGTDAAIFYYRILFDNTEAYAVVENTEDTAFNVILNMAWTGNEDYNVTYATSNDLVREHCITQNSSKGYVMYLRVFGLDGIDNLKYVSAEPTLNSNTTVLSVAKKMTQNY